MNVPLSLVSKKFIAYLLADITWTIIILGGLFRMESMIVNGKAPAAAALISLLMTMTICKTFLQVMFIGTQAALDRFTKLGTTALTSQSGKSSMGPNTPTVDGGEI